jgi:hypothetical protein
MRILIAGAHKLIRDGLRAIPEKEDGIPGGRRCTRREQTRP